MMEDLSGAPGFGGYFKDDEEEGTTLAEHIEILVAHSEAGSTVVLSSKEGDTTGIVGGHAYTLLQTFEHKGKRIFKTRNPWGNFEL